MEENKWYDQTTHVVMWYNMYRLVCYKHKLSLMHSATLNADMVALHRCQWAQGKMPWMTKR